MLTKKAKFHLPAACLPKHIQIWFLTMRKRSKPPNVNKLILEWLNPDHIFSIPSNLKTLSEALAPFFGCV